VRINAPEKIVDALILNKIVLLKDKELYMFGMNQVTMILLNFFTVIVIGTVLDMLWQSILFISAYMLIRIYAGGYHARTQMRCYLFSILIMLISLFAIKLLVLINTSLLIILLISSIIISTLAPVEDYNKPLNSTEKKVFGNYVRWILVCFLSIIAVSSLLGGETISLCLVVVIVLIAFMLILGEFKNSLIEK
jgi:accessory gene regulator B